MKDFHYNSKSEGKVDFRERAWFERALLVPPSFMCVADRFIFGG